MNEKLSKKEWVKSTAALGVLGVGFVVRGLMYSGIVIMISVLIYEIITPAPWYTRWFGF